MRILVLGYYNRNNLGDDAFEQAVPVVVGEEHEYRFVCVDDIAHKEAGRDPNKHYDLILLGGGDVVTNYFFRKVNALVSRFHNGPFVLFGAGITWPSCVTLGHLDQFDRVFLRNTTDLRSAERRLGTEFAHYLPDLVFSLCPYRDQSIRNTETNGNREETQIEAAAATTTTHSEVLKSRPRASFYLIQSIDRKNPEDVVRQQFVHQRLAQCVAYVALTHDVTLVRFNTCGTRQEDDLHISETIYRLCSDQTKEHVSVDTTDYRTPQAMLQHMSCMDINVCMRFHSHVFSTIQNVPFVSLMLTRKVEMLVDELGLANRCGVRLPRDEHSLQPLDVPVHEFCERFHYVVEHSDELRQHLALCYSERHALLKSGVAGRLLSGTSVRPERKLLPTFDGQTDGSSSDNSDEKESFLDTLVEKASDWWRARLGFPLLSGNDDSDEHSEETASDNSNSRTLVLSKFNSEHRVRHHVNTVCQRLCYSVTDEIQPKFMYGFVENMMRDPFRIREYLKWIMEERERQKSENGDMRRFHLDFIQQQDFCGAHRSGWAFAATHLRALHSDRGVLLDTCMDRTFHWGCDALRHGGVLPYTHSWCGIVHHTPETSYTDYNTTSMLENPLFRQSLLTCRGIYVLSESLKKWFDNALQKLPLTRIPPVCVLCHPTEVPPRKQRFTLRRFRNNKQRKLLHIGAWLRNTFALYQLALLDNASRAVARAKRTRAISTTRSRKRRLKHDRIDKSHTRKNSRRSKASKGYVIINGKKCGLRRCMLHGRNMSLYMPPPESSLKITCTRDNEAEQTSDCSAHFTGCRHNCGDATASDSESDYCEDGENRETKCTNKWVVGLREFVAKDVRNGVDVIESLDNDAYDNVLCENIVFLNLVNVSACNTLIECLVRNTPILINRLPAAEEVLGKHYPLFYDSLEEALVKSRCYESICAAHKHLKAIDKTPYRIESFINSIRDSTIYRNL